MMSSRKRAVIGGVATVVILAAVVSGIYAFSSPRHQSGPSTAQFNPGDLSDRAYQQGVKAMSSKDTTGAITLFEKALLYDPNNEDARKALQDAREQQSPSGQDDSQSPSQTTKKTDEGSTTTGDPDDPWSAAVSPQTLLPKTFPDYALGSVTAVGPDATVSGSPTKKGATITSIVWQAHDAETSAKSATYLTSVTKSLYSKDAASIKVNGVPAYFGTDGVRFAAVAYTRNRYVFEVVLTSTGAPASAKTVAEQAAAKFATQL